MQHELLATLDTSLIEYLNIVFGDRNGSVVTFSIRIINFIYILRFAVITYHTLMPGNCLHTAVLVGL